MSAHATFHESRLTGTSSIMHTKTRKTHVTLTFDLTLIFNRLLDVVEVHVHAKRHQAKYSGSWVIVFAEKKNLAMMLTTILPSPPRAVTITLSCTSNEHCQQSNFSILQLMLAFIAWCLWQCGWASIIIIMIIKSIYTRRLKAKSH